MHIRVMSRNGHESMNDDPVVIPKNYASRCFVVITCRNRQRKLQHAWTKWTQNTGVLHNYLKDVTSILSRQITLTEQRTEVEVEVFFKWVLQDYALDPTGITHTLYMCKSKVLIVRLIQRARLDRYRGGETVLLQGSPPQPDEGLFTIVRGAVDILVLPQASDQLARMQKAITFNDNDEIERILAKEAVVADTLGVGAGFGELSALTNARRAASIVACKGCEDVDLLVVTQQDLVDCVESRRDLPSHANPASAEVMDFMRQTGLANKAALMDVMQTAACITKKAYPAGTLLYKKGEPVVKAYIILSGEVFLDVGNFEDSKGFHGHFFQNINPDNCYALGPGSILGDEGMIGPDRVYDASAVVLSENFVVFEVTDFAIDFLAVRLGVEKYAALLLKNKSIDSEAGGIPLDLIVLHGTFNCLRKVYSAQNPYRAFNSPKYKDGPANFVIAKDKVAEDEKKKQQRQMNTFGRATAIPLSVSKPVSRVNKTARDKSSRQGTGDHQVLHRGMVSSEGCVVLSTGTLHHLHLIRKGIREREVMAMREIAEVWPCCVCLHSIASCDNVLCCCAVVML